MTTTPYRRTMPAATAGSDVTTAPVERYQRVHDWATNQSRKLELQALADMAFAAVERATALAYETVGGQRINLYSDARVKFVCPWAKHSKLWPLSLAQRELTRALLFAATRQHGKSSAPAPLFFFDGERRRWVCNVGDYPTAGEAMTWLRWARSAWTPETVVTALTWLETRTPDGRKRGSQMGATSGSNRALG